MSNSLILILIFTAIAIILGGIIVIISSFLPEKKKRSEKVRDILNLLPGKDCGSCSYPGCEKYAEALAEKPETIFKDKCPFIMKDEKKLSKLEKILGIKIKKR